MGEATLRVTDSDHGAPGRTFLQYLSLLLLAVVLHAAPVLAADPPFVFRDVASDRPTATYVAGGAEGPVPNRLLINRNGRFTRSEQPAIAWLGRASGVVLADLDNDGLADLYVGNNGKLGKENLLYHNRGDGRFENVTARAAAPMHLPDAARSVAVLDFEGDGLLTAGIFLSCGCSVMLGSAEPISGHHASKHFGRGRLSSNPATMSPIHAACIPAFANS